MAPEAVRVEELPAQRVAGDAVALTVGFGFTVMVMVPVPVHPPEAPVTVYVVVEAGLTVNGLAVPNPPDQVYVTPPVAVRTVELPLQMGFEEAETVTLRSGEMLTNTEAVPVQPLISVPVTT